MQAYIAHYNGVHNAQRLHNIAWKRNVLARAQCMRERTAALFSIPLNCRELFCRRFSKFSCGKQWGLQKI
jgi:hypothetical protein